MKLKSVIVCILLLFTFCAFSKNEDKGITDVALLISDQKYDEALPILVNLLKEEPQNDMAWYYSGQCYWVKGNYKTAIRCLMRATHYAPNNHHYYELLYGCLSNFENTRDLSDSLALVMKKTFPEKYNTPYMLTILAQDDFKNGRDSIAVSYLQEALAMDPYYAKAAWMYADYNREIGNMTAFFSYIPVYLTSDEVTMKGKTDYVISVLNSIDGPNYRIFNKRYDEMVDTLVNTYPTDSSALMLAGQWAKTTGKKELAEKYFQRIPELFPQSLSGWIFWVSNNYDDTQKAMSICKNGISTISNPKDKAALMDEYARLLYENGEKQAAFKYLDKALKLSPQEATILNNYAYYLSLEKTHLRKAAKMSKKALEIKPNNASFLDTYAWILHLQGKYEEARTYFKKALVYGGKDHKDVLEHYSQTLRALGENDLADYYLELAAQKSR